MALPEAGYVQPVEIVVGGTLPRSGWVQPVDIVGTGVSMAIGGLVAGGTPGSVLFVDAVGNLGQNNAAFFWDITNLILKVKNVQVSGSSPWADVKAYGAVGNGIADDTAAINAAITAVSANGGKVFFPVGTYLITSKISVPASVELRGVNPNASVIKKGYNGAMFDLAGFAGMVSLKIDGNNGAFTGNGAEISGATSPSQYIDRCYFLNFTGNAGNYCVEYTVLNAGSQSYIINSLLTTTIAGNVAVKYPTALEVGNPRAIINCQGGGSVLIDFGGANDCYFAKNYTNGLLFSTANASIVLVEGCRLATLGAGITVHGSAIHIINCEFAGTLTLAADATKCVIVGNGVTNWDITDLGTGNVIEGGVNTLFTPAWTAESGAAPAIGNGAIIANYSRMGAYIHIQIQMSFGTTTTFGSGGIWNVSLPQVDDNVPPKQIGIIRCQCAGVARMGTAELQQGLGTLRFGINNNSANIGFATSAFPGAWASGDFVFIDIIYRVL